MVYYVYCAGADGNTCGRKSRGDEKQLIDLEWPYSHKTVPVETQRMRGTEGSLLA